MDDKLTISTFQLFQMFPDQEAARLRIISQSAILTRRGNRARKDSHDP